MQLIDDVLDYTGSSSILGKPALNDLASGIATAPALFAAQEQPVRPCPCAMPPSAQPAAS